MSDIISLPDLQAYTPTDVTVDKDRGQRCVDAVNQWIETRTGRCWNQTKTVTDERYRWQNVIWLRNTDIQAVSAVKLGWPGQTQTTLDSANYFLDPLGRLTFYGSVTANGSRFYNDYLAISYSYGTTSVPDDLKLAALAMAADFYYWAINHGRDISAVSVGSYSVAYTNKRASGQGDPASSTADTNYAVIDSYRLRKQ